MMMVIRPGMFMISIELESIELDPPIFPTYFIWKCWKNTIQYLKYTKYYNL